jgi:hypothetical protein
VDFVDIQSLLSLAPRITRMEQHATPSPVAVPAPREADQQQNMHAEMQFDDDPGCSPPNVVDSACATSSNGAASASAAPILLPMPYTYSKRQFDRSSSFTGLTRNIELSVRGGASGGSSSSGSDDSDDDAAPGDRARSGSGRGGAEASWAQPHGVFEVDEPSTEIKFVMRGLREALTKKVRPVA